MITSNLGLYEVPHIKTPARLEDFVQNCQKIIIEDFHQIPCIFVPSMKNKNAFIDQDFSIDQMDMLRGEEVETYGLLEQLQPEGKGLIVLPRSHTKYIFVEEGQTLVSSFSTLGAGVISAIRSNTILSSSLELKIIETVDKSQLIAGFNTAKDFGLTRGFYHIRLMQLFSKLDHNKRASYFIGAVL